MAQPFGAGFKLGLPLTDVLDVSSGNNNNVISELRTKRYIFGPQFEVRLPAGFSVELDALYTKYEIDSVAGAATSFLGASFDGNSWEFPLMLKKKFGGASAVAASVRPFVAAGASFRRLSDIDQIGRFVTGRDIDSDIAKGFVIGGGLEIRALFLRVSPELRFTRWGEESFASGLTNVLKSNRNQAQLLVGFSF